MITQEYGVFSVVCDICDDEIPEKFDYFNDAVEGKKEYDWVSRKIEGEWKDLCPKCRESHDNSPPRFI
jgi:hypothetical protein